MGRITYLVGVILPSEEIAFEASSVQNSSLVALNGSDGFAIQPLPIEPVEVVRNLVKGVVIEVVACGYDQSGVLRVELEIQNPAGED